MEHQDQHPRAEKPGPSLVTRGVVASFIFVLAAVTGCTTIPVKCTDTTRCSDVHPMLAAHALRTMEEAPDGVPQRKDRFIRKELAHMGFVQSATDPARFDSNPGKPTISEIMLYLSKASDGTLTQRCDYRGEAAFLVLAETVLLDEANNVTLWWYPSKERRPDRDRPLTVSLRCPPPKSEGVQVAIVKKDIINGAPYLAPRANSMMQVGLPLSHEHLPRYLQSIRQDYIKKPNVK